MTDKSLLDRSTPSSPSTSSPASPRRYRSREQWADWIDRQASSGLTVSDFCQQHSLGPASFYAWRRRLLVDSSAGSSQAPGFVRLQTIPNDSELTAHLPGGVRITLTESALPALIVALKEADAC